MPDLSQRDRLARRSLDKIYNHFGKLCDLILPDGSIVADQRAKFDVLEAEQALDGSRIEVDIKGFTARFRRHTLPDDLLAQKDFGFPQGTRLRFHEPVLNYQFFRIDANPKAFNRDGGQYIAQLTPTSNPIDVPADEQTPFTQSGLPLG